jgi:AraC-like DNA-binding protein
MTPRYPAAGAEPPPQLISSLRHPHPFAQRVIDVALTWTQHEWTDKERLRIEAISHGWTAQRRAAHDAATLTADGLALRIDNISLSKLRRELKAIHAPSPGEIIRAARLQLAENLLRNSKLLIREVARRAGYSSEKHFASRFGAVFGCSPSDYRRSLFLGSGDQ